LPLVDASTSPRLAVDSHGTVYVALIEGANRHRAALYRSRDDGRTFLPTATHDAPAAGGTIDSVVLSVDPTDDVGWGWLERASSSDPGSLLVGLSTDGTTFSMMPNACHAPTMNECTDAWLAAGPSLLALSVRIGPPIAPSFPIDARVPSIAVSHAGAPFEWLPSIPTTINGDIPSTPPVIFPDGSLGFPDSFGGGTNAQLTYARFSGGQWSDVTIATTFTPSMFFLDAHVVLAADPAGGVSATFLLSFDRLAEPWFAWTHGDNVVTSSVRRPGWHRGTAALPTLTFDGSSRAHVAWMDDREGLFRVYTAWSIDGLSFTPEEAVSDQAFATAPSPTTKIGDGLALVIRDGRRYAAWSDRRDGTTQVYFASAAVPP
jgi:hypothetical protein